MAAATPGGAAVARHEYERGRGRGRFHTHKKRLQRPPHQRQQLPNQEHTQKALHPLPEPGSAACPGADHGRATAEMDGCHVHSQRDGGADGFAGGIRDVVKLQIEKDLEPLLRKHADDLKIENYQLVASANLVLHFIADIETLKNELTSALEKWESAGAP